jgi:hypothetical protein
MAPRLSVNPAMYLELTLQQEDRCTDLSFGDVPGARGAAPRAAINNLLSARNSLRI